jgi:Protein of Unknown function (DUF2784)
VLLASAVAVVHATAVALMLCGALLALRWRWVVYVHAPVGLAILAVNLLGAPCPLTTLEAELRTRAGAVGYSGGFLGHYLFHPLGVDVHSTAVQLGIHAGAVLPNALGYGLLAVRALHARRVRASPGHPRGEGMLRSAAVPSRTPAGTGAPSGSQR